VRAHLHDLRSEVDDTDAAQAMVDRFAADWRTAGLDRATEELLAFAERLTAEPASMGPDDIDRLRGVGWDERAIHDATQVCAYFNYINRIADALGVDHEDFIDEAGRSTDR
jgi:uncharacterized peroxidase-related enzyme